MLEIALAWAVRGHRVFPLHPLTKHPVWKGWTEVATTEEETIRRIWSERPYNVGYLTNDLICLDLDVKDGRDGFVSFMDLGLTADTLTVRTPSGGKHLLYRIPPGEGPFANSTGKLGDGVDVRSWHGFALAPGSFYGHGPYVLELDVPLAEFPRALLHRLSKPAEKTTDLLDVELDWPGALDHARQWLEERAPAIEGQSGDDHTYRTAAKLKDFGLSEEMALALLSESWNDRCLPPWPAEELRTKVSNAYEYGKNPAGVSSPQVQFDGVRVEPDVPAPSRSFHRLGDPWAGSVKWLYLDLLPTVGTCVFTAPSGAGKTFAALHLAKSLAEGSDFFGVLPTDRGGTILMAGEAYGSVKMRMAAIGERGPVSACYVGALAARGAWAQLCDDLRKEAAWIEEAHGVPVRLLILDTLSASGILEDENDNAAAANVMKAFSELSAALGALVVVIHHPTKSGVLTRGASAIPNNSDYVLAIHRDGKSPVRELEIEKSRDGECRPIGTFTLIPKDIQDGDEKATTMVLSTGEPRTKQATQSVKVERFQKLFDDTHEADPQSVDGKRAVRTESIRVKIGRQMANADKSNIRRRIREAIASGSFAESKVNGISYLVECSPSGPGCLVSPLLESGAD